MTPTPLKGKNALSSIVRVPSCGSIFLGRGVLWFDFYYSTLCRFDLLQSLQFNVVLERDCLLDFPSKITFCTKHFCRSHLPDEKASRAGNPSFDNVLDPILELKQRRIVREKKCSTFIDINSCLQRFETASMQCRMLKVNKIQLGFASRIPRLHFKQCVFVQCTMYICGFATDVFPLFSMSSHFSLVLYTDCFLSSGSLDYFGRYYGQYTICNSKINKFTPPTLPNPPPHVVQRPS